MAAPTGFCGTSPLDENAMQTIDDYSDAIHNAFPDFQVTSAVMHTWGQNNVVVLVNDTFIFRFPKYPEGRGLLEREVAILRGIRGRVSLAVPDPIFTYLDSPADAPAFVGYRLIPGEPLWFETVQSLRGRESVDRLAGQLAGFLRELHQVPLSAIPYALTRSDTAGEWAAIFERIRASVFPHMRAAAGERVAREFESFLEQLGRWEFQPVLKHGDFGTSNILYDAGRRAIQGIVDFGSAGLGDPAYDLAGLLGYGEDFVNRVIQADPALGALLERARFYHRTFALLEALSGIEHGDMEAFESGLAVYR